MMLAGAGIQGSNHVCVKTLIFRNPALIRRGVIALHLRRCPAARPVASRTIGPCGFTRR